MSSLPARMKKIQLKMKVLECSQDFSHYKSMEIFSRRPRAANSAVHGLIWSNFEIGRDFMVVLLTCKNEKIRSKIEALECSQHYTSIFRRARADNSGVGDGIWLKFELIQAFMHVLDTCRNEEDPIKNEGARVFTRFLPL